MDKLKIAVTKLAMLAEDVYKRQSNTNIRCFLVPEGSYINFLQSNIVPIGGLTSVSYTHLDVYKRQI